MKNRYVFKRFEGMTQVFPVYKWNYGWNENLTYGYYSFIEL
jgi:hypothetical protein